MGVSISRCHGLLSVLEIEFYIGEHASQDVHFHLVNANPVKQPSHSLHQLPGVIRVVEIDGYEDPFEMRIKMFYLIPGRKGLVPVLFQL